MSDLELMELAAKAIGEEFNSGHITVNGQHFEWVEWNPLTDDGDALRLAVKLHILVSPYSGVPHAGAEGPTCDEATENYANHGGDKCAATRRAIVRAAAEIGRATTTDTEKN